MRRVKYKGTPVNIMHPKYTTITHYMTSIINIQQIYYLFNNANNKDSIKVSFKSDVLYWTGVGQHHLGTTTHKIHNIKKLTYVQEREVIPRHQ